MELNLGKVVKIILIAVLVIVLLPLFILLILLALVLNYFRGRSFGNTFKNPFSAFAAEPESLPKYNPQDIPPGETIDVVPEKSTKVP